MTHSFPTRRSSDLSGEGNLLCTLLLRPGRSAAESALLSFVSAVALGDALAPFCPGVPISLKWPNDLLLNGRKVAGILLESESAPDGGDRKSTRLNSSH